MAARGGAMAMLAQAMVGSSFVAAAALDDYPIAGGQAARYAVAALVMFAIGRFRLVRPTRGELVRLTALAASGLAVFNAFIIVGVNASDPAAVGVVVGCVPILLALLGPLQRGAAPDPRVVAAGVVVAGGAAMVQGTGGAFSALGLVMAVGALLCEAAFTLIVVPVLPRLGPIGITQWACILAVPMLAGWALLVDGPGAYRLPTLTEGAALAWMVAAVTVVAFMAWYGAVKRIGPERAGLFCGTLPISAALLGVATGTVTLTPFRAAGALTVALGVTLGLVASAGRGRAGTRTHPLESTP